MPITIARRMPPAGPIEEPFTTPRGYKMADPRNGKKRHHADFAKDVRTLEGVVDGLKKGWLLWMKQDGKRETLIRPASLIVTGV
jgi:hypothetical protein